MGRGNDASRLIGTVAGVIDFNEEWFKGTLRLPAAAAADLSPRRRLENWRRSAHHHLQADAARPNLVMLSPWERVRGVANAPIPAL